MNPNEGVIVQAIGPVIDVRFSENNIDTGSLTAYR